jgi:hypothetical protein
MSSSPSKSKQNNVNLISSRILNGFITRIKNSLPPSDAVVIADKHGFPLASRIDQPALNEELLAVSAITDRKLYDLSDYQKIVQPLNNHFKIMVLLKKSAHNLMNFKKFQNLLEKENPF